MSLHDETKLSTEQTAFDRRDFLRFLSGGALILTSGGLLAGCGGGGGSAGGNAPSLSPLLAGQTLNIGNLTLPTGSPFSANQFVVQTTLDAGNLIANSSIPASGNYQVIASSQNNHLMMAVKNEADSSQTPYLLAISTGGQGTSPTIDENSTAAALVFLNPFITVTDAAAGKALLSQIASLPETAQLVSTIKNALIAGHSPLDGTDGAIDSALRAAVSAEILELVPAIASSMSRKSHALPIFPGDTRSQITLSSNGDVQDNGSSISIPLNIRNNGFRYIAAFYRPLEDSDTETVSATVHDAGPISGYDILNSSATGLSDTFSLIQSVAENKGLENDQQIIINGPIKNRYVVSFYGLGKGDNAFQEEGKIATTLTILFNAIAPIISVLTGVSSKDVLPAFKEYLTAIKGADEELSLFLEENDLYKSLKNGDYVKSAIHLKNLLLNLIESKTFRGIAGHYFGSHGLQILGKFFGSLLGVIKVTSIATNSLDAIRVIFNVSTSDSRTDFIIHFQGSGNVQITRLMSNHEQRLLCGTYTDNGFQGIWSSNNLSGAS